MGKRFHYLLIICGLVFLANRPQSAFAWQERVPVSAAIAWEGDEPGLVSVRAPGDAEVRLLRNAGDPQLFIRLDLGGATGFDWSVREAAYRDGGFFTGDLRQAAESHIAVERGRRMATVLLPLRPGDGEDKPYLESVNLSLLPRGRGLPRTAERTYAGESVMATGQWFKIGVEVTGVHRLSYEFLKSLGVDVDNVPHTDIRFYGHRGGMLPRRAGDERTDDLREIPVQVMASGATLRPGDYIIFYAEGPDKWTFNEAQDRFVHENHLYTDFKGYFVATGLGAGQRVVNAVQPPGQPSATYNEFDDHAFLEEDLYNLNKSGSDWLGEEFSINLQRSFTFPFPNLTGAPARIDYRVAARSTAGSSGFEMSAGGSVRSTLNIGAVGTQYTSNAANAASGSFTYSPTGDAVSLSLRFQPPNFSARGWLDYIAVNARRGLVYEGEPLAFRHRDARNHGVVRYEISGMNASVAVWDVTDLFDIRSVNYQLAGQQASFQAPGNAIGQYVAFGPPARQPLAFGPVANQNLHGLGNADYLLVTRRALLGPAQELAAFHANREGYTVHVVVLEEIFNEFASGNNDVTALRDFAKMFYDRGADLPKYLCIFGDGTFNNRELGEYFMPTFEGDNTLNTIATLVSDDYFGFLDDSEGQNINDISNLLDIAIGRIPADSESKAWVAVDKIKRYYAEAAYGNWRNVGAFVADDEDNNIHIDDGEEIANDFLEGNPVMNIEKIYLDAYRQEGGAGGQTYPDVNRAINNRLFKGTLFINYIGHGGGNGLADERILTLEDIDSWENEDKLTLIISATCEFARYDDFERYSAGERAFFKQSGGAIALVTTVRLVFSNENFDMNQSFMEAMELGLQDRSLSLGEITRIAKNNTPTGDGNRKFTLIGDPALKLAFPEFGVRTTAIGGQPYTPDGDTLNALTLVNFEGEVVGPDGLLDDFNGLVYPTVYDKEKTQFTLGNDARSQVIPFQTRNNIVYSGKVQATGGRFAFSFVVPKDIVYTIGDGKVSYYAHDGSRDAAGIDTVLIGGGGQLDSNSLDSDGPLVEVFMDDESFVSGDFTDSSPDLLVKLFDQNGINTVGSGIGHDIVAVLDDRTQDGIALNDFYEGDLNSYQSGRVLYPLEGIEPGTHTIRVKAWDVFNNSGEGYTEFVVAESADLALEHVLNYPNPFTTSTRFMFEHNRNGDVIDVRIEVFSVSGKLVKTLQQTAPALDRRFEIAWDGLDDYGDRIGKGVYIYKVSLKDSSGERVTQFQKLVLLR